jgi:hypothetical protein
VVLTNAATVGDSVVTESFYVSSVLNAIPATAGAVNSTYIANGAVGNTQMASGAARANFGAGAVLQVVQATLSGSVSTSSASFVTTGLTASITPASATNKILVTVSAGDLDSQAAGRQILATIYRNSTNLGNTNGFMDVYDTAGRIIVPVSIQYLDSPATTSSTTYTLYFTGQGTTVIYNAQGGVGVMTLMEIAG